VAIGLLALAACTAAPQQARFPLTTKSRPARQAYEQARDLLDAGRPTEARAQFARATEQDPNLALAWLGLAECAPSTAQRFEALNRALRLIEAISEGERRVIQGTAAGMNRNPGGRAEHYSTLVRLYPDDERAHLLLAEHRMAEQDHAGAASSVARAIQLAPDHAPAYLLLARIGAAQGDAGAAATAVEDYIRRRPDQAVGYATRGDALLKSGDFTAAAKAYADALARDGSFAAAHVGLGLSLLLLGREAEAHAAFASFSRQARDDAERRLALLWTGLAQALVGRPEQALDPLRERVALSERAGDPEWICEDQELVGDLLLDLGRADEAAEAYRAALLAVERSSLPAPVRDALLARQSSHEARVALARGDVTAAQAKALEYRERAARAQSDAEGTRQQELMAEIRLRAGDAQTAARMLQRLLPGGPRTAWLLARALIESGHPGRAVPYCRQAAQFNAPDPAWAFVRTRALAALPEFERQAAAAPPRRTATRPDPADREAAARRRQAPGKAPAPGRAEREAAARQRQADAAKARGPRPPAGR